MAKYRIKVEALDPAEELRAEYRIGIECDKFVILSEVEGSGIVDQSMHNVNNIDIARMLRPSKEMMASVMIAKGMYEADKYLREREIAQRLTISFGGVFGGDEE